MGYKRNQKEKGLKRSKIDISKTNFTLCIINNLTSVEGLFDSFFLDFLGGRSGGVNTSRAGVSDFIILETISGTCP